MGFWGLLHRFQSLPSKNAVYFALVKKFYRLAHPLLIRKTVSGHKALSVLIPSAVSRVARSPSLNSHTKRGLHLPNKASRVCFCAHCSSILHIETDCSSTPSRNGIESSSTLRVDFCRSMIENTSSSIQIWSLYWSNSFRLGESSYFWKLVRVCLWAKTKSMMNLQLSLAFLTARRTLINIFESYHIGFNPTLPRSSLFAPRTPCPKRL